MQSQGGSPQASVTGHRDFRRLWTGLAISQAGSAVGGTALPIVAISVLHASTLAVSLLAAVAAVTTVLVALPAGTFVEFRAKRPVLVASDVVRFVALLTVPAADVLHRLTIVQLSIVAVVNAVCQLVFASASQAHLVSLVSRAQLLDANGRMASTTWLSLSAGPSVAGVLIGVLSAAGTLIVDAVSYLASAAAVLLIRTPEPAPPVRVPGGSRRAELLTGWRFVGGDSVLRRLLLSWFVYAGFSGMLGPIASVFYLRELSFAPWQYGLILGLPSLAGFAGSRLTRPAAARFGAVRTLRWASVFRAPWYLLIVFAVRGGLGVTMCCLGFGGLLFFSALANSAMTGFRQLQTPDELLSRVATLWSFVTSAGQPVFIVLGGVLAQAVGLRAALLTGAVGMFASAFVLPRGQ